MKKLMTIFTVLFVFMTMTFGQENVFFTTAFKLSGGNSDLFVKGTPDDENAPEWSGIIRITFKNIIVFNSFNLNGTITSIDDIVEYKSGDGTYCIEFRYLGLRNGDVFINFSQYTPSEFTQQDTLNAFMNGVASVDTSVFYNNGVASVDTQSFYDNGFMAGVESVVCNCNVTQDDVDEAYNSGLSDGADFTVDADDYQSGFEAGKSSCGTNGVAMTSFDMGVNVYPNPVNNGGDITVDCPFFESVTVLTITGQVVETYTTKNVPTTNLTTGVYFLNVKNTDGNVSATKVLVK